MIGYARYVRSIPVLAWMACAVAGSAQACAPFGSNEVAGAPDGGGSNDAAAAGPDGASPGQGFCADAGAAFCDDFERSEIGGAWGAENSLGASSLVIDDAFSASASRSLRVFAPMGADSAHVLTRPTRVGATVFHLSFAMRLAELPAAGCQFAAVNFAGRNKVYLTWNQGAARLSLNEQDFPDGGTEDILFDEPVGVPPVGRFVRYDLRVDVGANIATLETDEPGLRATMQLRIPHLGPLHFAIGNVYTKPSTRDRTVWFDDVRIE